MCLHKYWCFCSCGDKMDLRRSVLAAALAVLAGAAAAAPGVFDSASLKNIANVSYASNAGPGDLSSLFSPRMDFDQWKPLTGRGDPLRNDPTYDYEPPVLERVHYWADEPRPEREHRPERKSEVLMLGVSSRKPSVAPRQPPRRHHRPTPIKYEDFSYKISEHYPMTILVPPPPPPPGHKLPLFILSEEKLTTPNHHIRTTERPSTPSHLPTADASMTSLYAFQEANLIFQSSTTSQNWILDVNQTKQAPDTAVSSDYAGWGPTTPIDDEDSTNETHNFIFNDHFEISKHPYSFYRPMLSEAPPPPDITPNPLMLPTFVPTALPPTTPNPLPSSTTQTTMLPETTTEFFFTETDLNINEEITTDTHMPFRPTSLPQVQSEGFLGMFGPMLSMPLVGGPERPEDNLYAHASENLHVFQENPIDETTIESMQTMQPPPPSKTTESTTTMHKIPLHVNALKANQHKTKNNKPLDPYLHMRFTTPPTMPTVATDVEFETVPATGAPAVPTYLIIQGHSKVKTYSSKNKSSENQETVVNEIPKPNETNEVKHLHPIKDKNVKKVDKIDKRAGRAKNLQTLVNEGLGSIEIQEADIGIKYDVSDGSEVPQEIYRKGIVENDENDYSSKKTKRSKRQLGLEDLLPFDEEDLEEYVFDFLNGRRNETGITGLIASAVTGDTEAGEAVEEIEADEDDR